MSRSSPESEAVGQPGILQSVVVSRRTLMAGSAAMAATFAVGTLPGKAVDAKPAGRGGKQSEIEQYLALIGQQFVVAGGDLQGTTFNLTDVTVHEERPKNGVPRGVRTEPFALQFISDDTALPRNVFATFTNADLGEITLGLQLIGSGAASRYEAVFG